MNAFCAVWSPRFQGLFFGADNSAMSSGSGMIHDFVQYDFFVTMLPNQMGEIESGRKQASIIAQLNKGSLTQ